MLTQSLCGARQWMRHRLDTRSVGTIELADEVENARKALLIDRNLGLLQFEPGQVSDARDLFACERHKGFTKISVKNSAKSYSLPCPLSHRLLDYAPLLGSLLLALFPVASCSNACADTFPAISRSIWAQPTH